MNDTIKDQLNVEEAAENTRIRELEEKIIWLQGELKKERRKSMSLWESFKGAFLKEGNTDDQAVFWSNEMATVVNRWINSQRQEINKVAQMRGMPPYTACLNDLSISLTPPGEPLPELMDDVVAPIPNQLDLSTAHYQPQTLLTQSLSFVSQPVPSSMAAPQTQGEIPPGEVIKPRVNVPRPFAASVARANVPGRGGNPY